MAMESLLPASGYGIRLSAPSRSLQPVSDTSEKSSCGQSLLMVDLVSSVVGVRRVIEVFGMAPLRTPAESSPPDT